MNGHQPINRNSDQQRGMAVPNYAAIWSTFHNVSPLLFSETLDRLLPVTQRLPQFMDDLLPILRERPHGAGGDDEYKE